jgi:hypothetical protein
VSKPVGGELLILDDFFVATLVSTSAKANVDNSVVVKAPDFNTFQQGVAWKLQTFQFKASNFHTFSKNFNKL